MADEAVVFEDKIVRNFLKDISRNMKSPEKVEQIVAAFSAIVFKDVMSHFKDEKGPDGSWKAWSRSYQRHMEKIGRSNNKILQFSGRLRQNFKPEKRRIKKDQWAWFNDAKTKGGFPYAWAHNEGTGKLPRRRYMWLSSKALDTMADVVWDFIIKDAEDGS